MAKITIVIQDTETGFIVDYSMDTPLVSDTELTAAQELLYDILESVGLGESFE